MRHHFFLRSLIFIAGVVILTAIVLTSFPTSFPKSCTPPYKSLVLTKSISFGDVTSRVTKDVSELVHQTDQRVAKIIPPRAYTDAASINSLINSFPLTLFDSGLSGYLVVELVPRDSLIGTSLVVDSVCINKLNSEQSQFFTRFRSYSPVDIRLYYSDTFIDEPSWAPVGRGVSWGVHPQQLIQMYPLEHLPGVYPSLPWYHRFGIPLNYKMEIHPDYFSLAQYAHVGVTFLNFFDAQFRQGPGPSLYDEEKLRPESAQQVIKDFFANGIDLKGYTYTAEVNIEYYPAESAAPNTIASERYYWRGPSDINYEPPPFSRLIAVQGIDGKHYGGILMVTIYRWRNN